MHCNYIDLLDSIYGVIDVQSLYPYFCCLENKHQYVDVMLQFLNFAKSVNFDVYMWGIDIPVHAYTDDPKINEWIDKWNRLADEQTVGDIDNTYQTLIIPTRDGQYALTISEISNPENVKHVYIIDPNQAREVLYIMLSAFPFNQDGIYIYKL